MDIGAFFLQRLLQTLSQFLVHVGDQRRKGLQDRNFCSKCLPDSGKFHTDHTAADDQQRRKRFLIPGEQFVTGHHTGQIMSGNRRNRRNTAGCQQDLASFDGDRICSIGCDLYLLDPFIAGSICACINDGSQSLINRNFSSFQKSGNALLQSGDGCLLVRLDFGQIGQDMLCGDTETFCIADLCIEF